MAIVPFQYHRNTQANPELISQAECRDGCMCVMHQRVVKNKEA
jgi:hypothetical protein